MGKAYGRYSNRKYYTSGCEKAVEYGQRAFEIDSSVTKSNLFLDNYIGSLYNTKLYDQVISLANEKIKKDTIAGLRILNFIIPNFNYLAQSQLAIGDTARAVATYVSLAKNFDRSSWLKAGLYTRRLEKFNKSNDYFNKAILYYNDKIGQDSIDWGSHLSLLETLVIAENFQTANDYLIKLKKLNIKEEKYKIDIIVN